MTKKTATAAAATDAQIADAVRSLFGLLYPNGAPVAAAPVVEADEDEVEDDEEEEVVELPALDRDKVAGMGIKDLRATAKEYLGDDAPTKKQEILDALEEFYEDAADEEEPEDEDEVEEVEEDEEGLSRDDLEEMDLKELRTLAKENGFKAADYRGMDQDALIDLLMGEDEEEEEDEEEDEDEADEVEEDEEEVEEIDEDALNEMSLTELKSLAKEIGVKVKVPASAKTDAKKKKVYVEAILESGEED